MTQAKLQRWVIAGQGAAAWMTAALLANTLDARVCGIVVCGADGSKSAGADQQAMRPHFQELLAALGADREGFIQACRGHYKLADRLAGWTGEGSIFYHATGDYGANLGAVEFVQALGRLRAQGASLAPLEAYSLGATCAQSGKFVPSSADPASILSSYQYGCSLSVPNLIDWLKVYCRQRGVTQHNSEVVSLQPAVDGVTIDEVQLANGETVSGDFFIDTTPEAVLHSQLGSITEDWSSYLPSEAAYHLNCDQSSPAPVVTLAAQASGWYKQVSSALGTTLSFYGLESELTAEIIERWQQPWSGRLSEKIDVRALVRARPWAANCLALGPAAIRLPSPALSELDLTWHALNQLLKHFPMYVNQPSLSEEYNRVMRQVYERCRDLSQMYFLAADSSLEKFWQCSQTAVCSGELNHKISLFRARGRIPFYEYEVSSGSWQSYLLLGMGLWPLKVDPLACQVDSKVLQQHCQKIQTAIAQMAGQLPEHTTYLQQERRRSQPVRPSGE